MYYYCNSPCKCMLLPALDLFLYFVLLLLMLVFVGLMLFACCCCAYVVVEVLLSVAYFRGCWILRGPTGVRLPLVAIGSKNWSCEWLNGASYDRFDWLADDLFMIVGWADSIKIFKCSSIIVGSLLSWRFKFLQISLKSISLIIIFIFNKFQIMFGWSV